MGFTGVTKDVVEHYFLKCSLCFVLGGWKDDALPCGQTICLYDHIIGDRIHIFYGIIVRRKALRLIN